MPEAAWMWQFGTEASSLVSRPYGPAGCIFQTSPWAWAEQGDHFLLLSLCILQIFLAPHCVCSITSFTPWALSSFLGNPSPSPPCWWDLSAPRTLCVLTLLAWTQHGPWAHLWCLVVIRAAKPLAQVVSSSAKPIWTIPTFPP